MRIDVHAHYYPRVFNELVESIDGVRRRGTEFIRGFSHHVSTEGQLELMDATGIDRQVQSLGNSPPYYEDRATAVRVARLANDVYTELHQQHPQRFNSFISVPLPHVDAALEELDRGLQLPGSVGVALGCSVRGKPLDGPEFDPLFAELNRRSAVTFIHPVGAGGGPNSEDFGLTWMLASRFEDTIAAARLVLSGLTLKYPDIRFIVPHLGGTLPLFLQRMDNTSLRAGWSERHPEAKPSELVKRMWFDTVNEHPAALRCACDAFGVDRLMLGTDWPMLAPEQLKHFVDYVGESVSADDTRTILDVTAARLLGFQPAVFGSKSQGNGRGTA